MYVWAGLTFLTTPTGLPLTKAKISEIDLSQFHTISSALARSGNAREIKQGWKLQIISLVQIGSGQSINSPNSVITCSPSSQWNGRCKEYPKQVKLTMKLNPTYIDFGVGR